MLVALLVLKMQTYLLLKQVYGDSSVYSELKSEFGKSFLVFEIYPKKQVNFNIYT